MSVKNTPDDWNTWSAICATCGVQTHASEHYACDCGDEDEDAEGDLELSYTYRVEVENGAPVGYIKQFDGEREVDEVIVRPSLTLGKMIAGSWVLRQMKPHQVSQLNDEWRKIALASW